MIYVPSGAFKMGRDDAALDERPAHEVKLKPFFIDRYEVTCEQYRKFVEATGHRAPKTWVNGTYPQGTAHWPVTGVTWSDATAFANWSGKRLPTEEEWELAARGTDGRLYPWGNQWRQSSDTTASANAFNTSAGHLVDVGTFKGASPFGAYDMVGNAWEWTASDWAAYSGGSLTKAPPYPDMKVMRGNFWEADDQHATTTFRIGWPADAADPNVSYKNAGFRCAKDAPATANAH
jgi:serine/threonine-protein kinase